MSCSVYFYIYFYLIIFNTYLSLCFPKVCCPTSTSRLHRASLLKFLDDLFCYSKQCTLDNDPSCFVRARTEPWKSATKRYVAWRGYTTRTELRQKERERGE